MKMVKLLSMIFAFALLGCEGRVTTEQKVEELRLQRDYDTACAEGRCPCPSPLGLIVDGGTAVAYNAASVKCGTTCESQQITLTCHDGVFDKDISTVAFSCSVDNCKACTVGNNQVPHGFTTTLYKSSTVACGTSCEDSKRALVCFDGTLQSSMQAPAVDGSDAQYTKQSCAASSCSCAMPNGGTLSLGGSLKFYKSSTGTCEQVCDDPLNMQTRTCTNTGTAASPTFAFDGDTNFKATSCTGPTAAQCNCVLPDPAKTVIKHGEAATLYTKPTPYNCITCAAQKLDVYCGSGVLYNKPITDATKTVVSSSALTSHPSVTCDDTKTPDCFVNNICIADKSSKTLYGKSTLVCGDDLKDLTATFSCTAAATFKNGSAYVASSDSYATTWTQSQPTNMCIGCKTPWGISVEVGKTVTAFKSSVESSNTCGGGCKSYEIKCTATTGAPVFKSGDPLIDADLVTNAKLYKSACDNVCTQEGGGAPPRMCLLPWQNSFVSADSLVPLWKKKSVVCGDSCQNHFKLGKCQMSTGTFDAGLEYTYQACTEIPCGNLKLTSINPTYLPPAGGRIQLTGTGFASGMTVTVGGQTCQSVSVASATSASCTVTAGTALYQDVLVASGSEKAMLPGGFSYYSGTCASGPGMKVYRATNSNQTFVVPAGCSAVSVTAWGGGGGGRYSYNYMTGVTRVQFGGAGGFSQGLVAVSSGQTLGVVVGGGGGSVDNWGSGGGGYSGIFSATAPSSAAALVIAGGGGGAGDPFGCNGGKTGGEGGGSTGGTNGPCSGLAGTQSAGGLGGPGAKAGTALAGAGNSTGVQGGFGGGGTSGPSSTSGGGGGGGYFGGGAGADGAGLGGAGGGGSGYLKATAVTGGTTLNGSGRYPPSMKDSRYQQGVGLGGGRSSGGPGLVVIEW